MLRARSCNQITTAAASTPRALSSTPPSPPITRSSSLLWVPLRPASLPSPLARRPSQARLDQALTLCRSRSHCRPSRISDRYFFLAVRLNKTPRRQGQDEGLYQSCPCRRGLFSANC